MSDAGVKLFSSDGQQRMDRWREQVEDLQQRGKGLTSWELQFIESIDDRLSEARPLTDRQEEILQKIYDERIA